jgi:hypothetical protein
VSAGRRVIIAKDFHSAKDFPRIRGKSFVIMVDVAIPAGLSGHTRQVITLRPARIVWGAGPGPAWLWSGGGTRGGGTRGGGGLWTAGARES